MKRGNHRLAALLLALCVALTLISGVTRTANAADVSYLDENGATRTAASATEVTASDTTWGSAGNITWYVVNSALTNANRITVTGDVRLILADSAELTASGGINIADGNSLTIYAQSTGDSMGKLSATGGDFQAGIGGGNGETGGAITINGGAVTAIGGNHGAGIGGGYSGAGGAITINGGAVTATGGSGGAGGAITINGGEAGAGIGGGAYVGADGEITINGGTVTANGGRWSAGIGGGYSGACGAISITGGTVNANGNSGGNSGDDGAGIGGGEDGDNSGEGNSISITGGDVTATVPNGTKGAAIGNGGGTDDAKDASVTIGAGLTVKAGTSADGTGAAAVTDVANNTTYKYAKITFAASASAPDYTVTVADTDGTSSKKYHYGDTITMAVTVSGGAFEGGEFTLTYNKDVLQLTTPDANNVVTETQTAGTYKFEMKSSSSLDETSPLATMTFTVIAKVTSDTTCGFAFTSGTVKVCYDTQKDSVAPKTVTDGSVTIEPITYNVTLTGESGEAFVNASNTVITSDSVIDGNGYSVTIQDYNATEYEYGVTLAVEGTDGTTALTPVDGVITVEKESVTGNLTITVTRTTKHVTVTLEGGLLTTASTDAIKGVDYSATIDGYDAANYDYTVTLTMNGAPDSFCQEE